MTVELVQATEQDLALVKNLVPYYIYDMSEYMGWDCNIEGRYDGCDDLPKYWQEPRHYAYLIRVDGKLAGFAMAGPYPDETDRMEMGDFFVLRKFKRQGIGRTIACQLFNAHPGDWLVRVLDENTGARQFWHKVISDYTRGDLVQTAEEYNCPHSGTWPMQFYRFESSSS